VAGKAKRAGLLATQSIRAGANRRVLQRIKESGDIFYAQSDRPWILDGAAVRVSMVGFDHGAEKQRSLNGAAVAVINPDLSSALNLTTAERLLENVAVCFEGVKKYGAFDIGANVAQRLLLSVGNPNGRPNSDVIRPWVNGSDLTGRGRGMWIIDFGVDMPLEQAAMYQAPFEYVAQNVRPERAKEKILKTRDLWWLFERPRPELRRVLSALPRFIATPRVAKHRIFVWLAAGIVPDSRLYAFVRADDYFFGVLHSHVHEAWSLATSSRHGVGNDPTYNNTTCFETFPFPWPPGQEPAGDPRVEAIAGAARALVAQRDAWLNPVGASEAELKKRTLTNLYNARPTWLDLAHRKLDAAVLDAYGWPWDPSTGSGQGLSDEEILARLLALNLERAAADRNG
jgi:type II restriction/modification system DNA methylase subunit YeeA